MLVVHVSWGQLTLMTSQRVARHVVSSIFALSSSARAAISSGVAVPAASSFSIWAIAV